ncbi:MAG: transcription antitermination factor NusB, partial [Chroococcales cyanobacterium]
MASRKQPRRIARQLALLSLSQLSSNPEKLAQEELNNVVLAAIRTLRGEIHETLETAAAEIQRSNDRLLSSETRASSVTSAKAMIREALELAQSAINRLGDSVELPEVIQMANQYEVREFTIELLQTVNRRRSEIYEVLDQAIEHWQLNRLPKVDRDILSIAIAEMMFLGTPAQVAINEAVELAKQYSDEEGHRFINGVLRRVTNYLKKEGYT